MTQNTARFILKRHGLACFSPRELRDLLSDRYMPLPADVKTAITTLQTPLKPSNYRPAYIRAAYGAV